jgi:predicted porin
VTPGTGVNTVRASNSIGYFLPANIGGIYGQVQYAENELRNNCTTAATPCGNVDAGRYLGGRVGFASGPVNVAVALGRTDANSTAVGTDDMLSLNVGGQFDFGFLKLQGQVVLDRNLGGVDDSDAKGFLIGGLVPVGAGEIRLAYSQYRTDFGGATNPKLKKLAVGYVHNLSKRTAIYTTLAHQKTSGGAAIPLSGSATFVNDKATALDLGIRHSF